MNESFPHPLRLAVGSHSKGSGKGCAMNVVSYENGDKEITDFPSCSDRFLARVVQRVNDAICTHTSDQILCPPCSVKALDLGHRTVGTALEGWDKADVAKVYVTIAVEQAESVLHLNKSGAPRRTVALVREWLNGGPVTSEELRSSAAYVADAASYYVASAAYYVASAASYAASYGASYAASYAASYGGTAAYYVADAAAIAASSAADDRLAQAHRIIDRFEELTEVKSQKVSTETTINALKEMETVSV